MKDFFFNFVTNTNELKQQQQQLKIIKKKFLECTVYDERWRPCTFSHDRWDLFDNLTKEKIHSRCVTFCFASWIHALLMNLFTLFWGKKTKQNFLLLLCQFLLFFGELIWVFFFKFPRQNSNTTFLSVFLSFVFMLKHFHMKKIEKKKGKYGNVENDITRRCISFDSSLG